MNIKKRPQPEFFLDNFETTGYCVSQLRWMYLISILFLLIHANCTSNIEDATSFDPLKWVNPNLGSVHARWFFYTPAANPYGMAKPAPHTNAYNAVGSWLPGGYDDRHNSIEGFGQFHEFQIGGVVVMPTTGDLKTLPGSLENPDEGYRSRFDKHEELAQPGYYSVRLKDYQIKTEITSTDRVAFYRFTYPESEESQLIFDIGHKQGESSDVVLAKMEMIDDDEFNGELSTYPEYAKFCDKGNHVKMFFSGRLSKPVSDYGTFVEDTLYKGQRNTRGVGNGMYMRFSTETDEIIELKIGLSYTSVEQARINLDGEAKEITFDEAKEQAQNSWREKLGRIKVSSRDTSRLIKFYTGLYHALLGRGLASDIGGTYRQNDGTIGQIPKQPDGTPKYHHYNTDGIWGGFWNLGQLWALVYPEYLKEYLQSNLDFQKVTGWLHDGVASGVYTNGVQTNFFGLMLALAYHCQINLYDEWEEVFEVAYKNETKYQNRDFGSGRYDLGYFVNQGYIHSYDTTLSNGWVFNFGASHTLEFAFSSYAVASMAQSLGKIQEFKQLSNQANYWKNLFDPETKYIRPRYANGDYIEDFDPMQPWRGFQEGNAAQYTWYAPHDPASLIKLLGLDLFNQRLDQAFTQSENSIFGGGKELDSFSGLEKLYNQGNQPCLFQPWLFNYSRKPWLTQKWVQAICDQFYGTEPLHGYGYGQDEDQGQLGAWYVMSSIGLFDVQGHTSSDPTFQIGTPLFDKVEISLPGDKTLKIHGQPKHSGKYQYIQSATFDGMELKNGWMYRDQLVEGGILDIVLDTLPNTDWGIALPPPSMSNEHLLPRNIKATIEADSLCQYVKQKALDVVGTGFNAGDGYGEVWIRDYNTFIELAMEVHDSDEIKENLLVFFRMQGETGDILDGFIPKSKADDSEGGYDYRYSGLEPRYAGHKNTVETDQESSLIQAVYKYVMKSEDWNFLAKKIGDHSIAERMEQALQWLMEERYSDQYGLIYGATTADWGDVQPEHDWGVFLTDDTHYAIDIYDNAMLIIALNNFIELVPEKRSKWLPIRNQLFDNARRHLWDSENQKFIPHIYLDGSPFPDDLNENEIYYHGGTAVAIEAGLLSTEEIATSLQKMIKNVDKSGAGSIGLTMYPPYPAGSFKGKGMYPFGYQNGGDWTWFGGRMIQQLIRYGFVVDAYEQMLPMFRRVKENQGFYEWYTVDKQPTGSGTFRGSAGVLFKSIEMLENY